MSDPRSIGGVGDFIEISPSDSNYQASLTPDFTEAVEWHFDDEFEAFKPEPKQDTLARIVNLPLRVAKMEVHTKVIKRNTAWNKIFNGFERMRAISYIVSPDTLLEFFDNGYTSIEVVVGESIVDEYKEQLSKKAMELTERLHALVETGELVVYGSTRPIHTKMYILENESRFRVIIGSPNMTKTAKAARQINYCVYIDLDPRDTMVSTFIKDYEDHKGECTRFMEDLLDQLSRADERDREKVIEVWLKSEVTDEEVKVRKMYSEISEQALGLDGSDEMTPYITISMDKSAPPIKSLTKGLKVFNPKVVGGHLMVERSQYLDHKKHPVPLMNVDLKKKKIVIGLDGRLIERTKLPNNREFVGLALAHIEEYMNTVDLGTSADPLITKTSMYEALLDIFTAPFFNEYMKKKREIVGDIDLRGPRFLYIYGTSHNGKTTFMRFVLKMMAGAFILPLPGNEVHKHPIYNASNVGTSFPLVYDDVPHNKWNKNSSLEEVCKNYWERRWNPMSTFPQLVLTSNEYRLHPWAKTRIKLLEFDVLFKKNVEHQKKLNDLISVDNPIFMWFSALYIQKIEESARIDEDELSTSREVMKDLYRYAGRPIPDFFPDRPVEEMYDIGMIKWTRLVHKYKKVSMKKVDDTIHLTFKKDISRWEIREHLGYLPQYIKCDQKGNLVIVQNPDDFIEWLEEGQKPTTLKGKLKALIKR